MSDEKALMVDVRLAEIMTRAVYVQVCDPIKRNINLSPFYQINPADLYTRCAESGEIIHSIYNPKGNYYELRCKNDHD